MQSKTDRNKYSSKFNIITLVVSVIISSYASSQTICEREYERGVVEGNSDIYHPPEERYYNDVHTSNIPLWKCWYDGYKEGKSTSLDKTSLCGSAIKKGISDFSNDIFKPEDSFYYGCYLNGYKTASDSSYQPNWASNTEGFTSSLILLIIVGIAFIFILRSLIKFIQTSLRGVNFILEKLKGFMITIFPKLAAVVLIIFSLIFYISFDKEKQFSGCETQYDIGYNQAYEGEQFSPPITDKKCYISGFNDGTIDSDCEHYRLSDNYNLWKRNQCNTRPYEPSTWRND